MSWQENPSLPPDLKAAVGHAGDDVAAGQSMYAALDAKTHGDLGKMNQDAGSVIAACNVLGDPHASIEAVAAAVTTLTTLALTYASTAAGEAALASIGAGVAVSVPIVGWAVIAFMAVVVLIYEILPHAQGVAPKEYTDQQKFDFALAQIPPDMPVPAGAAEPTIDAVKVMTLLSIILDKEKQGIDASYEHQMLAQGLSYKAGFASDIYHTVRDIVFDPRWQCGFPAVWLLAETQMNQPRPNGQPGFDVGSTFDEAAALFQNQIPHNLPYETFVAPDGKRYVKLGEGPGPIDVSRYLIIYSVLYHLKSPEQARAATYAAVYQILIQKAWQFTAGERVVAPQVFASMGFLLDQISKYPLKRLEQSSLTVQQALAGNTASHTTVFHDLKWYVGHYLALDPRFAAPPAGTPFTATPVGGGAQQMYPTPPAAGQAAPPVQILNNAPGGFSSTPLFRR